MRAIKNWFFTAVLALIATAAYSQGSTTSALGGKVTDNVGEPLPGANVVAIHMPSGTKYGATTDFEGFYRISNMRTGGPYKITVSYVGFQNFDKEGEYLQLGQTGRVNVQLQESATELDAVVVTGVSGGVFNSGKTGAETIINKNQINNLPALSRNIADFARLTPQAQLRGDDIISIAGQNNRYNAIYIDGAVNNDVFGLAANGTNGGQTGVSPISVDAIEQFQVQVAPFDVKISGFAGGAISAITRSGTNQTEGSAYFLHRDERLAGKTPPMLAGSDPRTRLADFTAQTYGVRLGGALVKDKLFYFVNYERQDNETPQPFNIQNYTGSSTATDLDDLRNFLINTYNYDPGTYTNNLRSLVSDKLIGKIDWNVNDNNKLSFKHSYVKAQNIDPSRSTDRAINYINGGQNFLSTTNSTSVEWNYQGNKVANSLVLGYTAVRDDRNPTGTPFPNIEIQDGSGRIFLGSEAFSTSNLLNQDVFTLTDNFEIYAGRHTVTIGTHNEWSSSKNVFFGRNFGYYRFSNLNDFMTGQKANRYRIGYSLVGGNGDDSLGAAEFDVFQLGVYVQDEVRMSDNFKLTAGLRFDVPYWNDGTINQDFNTRTIALLEAAGKDLQGARVGRGVSTTIHVSPRVGFNWDVEGNRSTQIRGGFGIFTSRLPLVWPGGAYNNNGVTQGALDITGASNTPVFTPDVNNQYKNPLPGSGQVGGNIDLFASNFKLPQIFKVNLAVDQKLPGGLVASADFIYNENITAIKYENLNLAGPQFYTTGGDVRPHYGGVRVDNTYQGVYLASNTSEGHSWNASFTLSKNFRSEFLDITAQGTYSYGDSKVWFDATSSQNSSQWNNIETAYGSNMITGVSRSDFAQGHRFIGNSTFEFKWNENMKTRFGFFYEGAQGQPFSWVYNDNGNLMRDTFSFSALAYIPANQNEIVLLDDSSTGLTAQQQWNALDAYIESNEYLRSRRGDFAERNGDRLKWSHVVDLKVAQEFGVMINNKRHAFELTADIFNFTNLLNKDWGKRYFASFDQVQLLNYAGFASDGTTPQFRFNPSNVDRSLNQLDDAGLQSSRWQMQLGVRYTFN